jgi:trimethylamine---corrinoid protein Co-methyltransferase
MIKALLTYSDKPFMGSVNGKQNARDAIEMAKIALGNIKNKPSILALININSPLRLDKMMAEAMVEYIDANQPVLFTPGIMMGITAPVTVAGALVQATAELMGCVAIAQVVNPGLPVIIGLGGFAADLKTARSGFGRPEQALATLVGAQIARRLKLPFRSSAMVTGSHCCDCRSGYERMMTAMGSWSAGTHLCLQAMGILDSINSMSYEQFIIDAEIWSYIKRIASSASVDEKTLATDVITSSSGDYLTAKHTLEYMRSELYSPELLCEATYENWFSAGRKDVLELASQRVKSILGEVEQLQINSNIKSELDKFITCMAG